MKNINFFGVRTNNLKNINISLEKNTMIALSGPNGSGKTSLAYETIEKISKYEFNKILGVNEENTFLDIDSYENIVPTAALKQLNYNTNPKSTIATFTGIDHYFKQMFAYKFHAKYSDFSFNNYTSACENCNALGYEFVPDDNLIIDYKKSLKEFPFKTWNNFTSNHYYPLLYEYCKDNNIPLDLSLDCLSKQDLKKILYSDISTKKYAIKFKQKNTYKNKLFPFIGVLTEINQYIKSNQKSDNQKIKSYVKQILCTKCYGSRFSDKLKDYKIASLSIGDMYSLEITELFELFMKINQEDINQIVKTILMVLKTFIASNLGYLTLNRSIPSLSGGELQRLRLSNILHSNISNILYILDEPSSSIYYKELDGILEQIISLKNRGNTILLIDHNEKFIQASDKAIYLGPGAGINGGMIVEKFIDNNIIYKRQKHSEKQNLFCLQNISFNNILNISITFPLNSLIGICGPSGSGKTSLAIALHQNLDNSTYISQKPLHGNINSIIATYIEIFDCIKNEFCKYNKISKNNISFTDESGACEECNGKGYTFIDIPFGDIIKNTCTKCHGNKFNQLALSYKYHDLNILDILKMPIEQLIYSNIFQNVKKISEKLKYMAELGLGYLTLFQEISSLSGGESQRLKIVKNISYTNRKKIYIIDEAFSGVDKQNISKTLKLFDDILNHDSTIFIIEHNKYVLDQCDYIIEIGPGQGKNGGKIINSNYI
ncbi:ATP-binding cassette domain-containing protein [Sulfurospirillum sp. UCH001]|uniref:ATP-binding cassette domain-containing protein n=1 Tax=Sulfurospirillum sp. UCH001 TaxID=1581011 RepID=UPI00082DD1A3|nr:ATP-binding cassette domain-containing protein [Sulfurospirillum sp. UCH001]